MPGRGLGIIPFQIEPISRLCQLISLKINQGISSFLEDLFNDEAAIPQRLNFTCSQGILLLGINQDKVSFGENPRFDCFIILNLNPFLMHFFHRGGISTLLIKMFQMKKAFFETRSVQKKLNNQLKRGNFTLNQIYRFQPISQLKQSKTSCSFD